MRKAVTSRQWPIYLFGAVGRGKSFAAAYVFSHWTGDALMLRYCDLINSSIRAEKEGTVSRIASDGSVVDFSPGQWWRWLRDVSLLVVDEIGTGMSHEWREEMLWKLLEERKGRPLLLTSNLTLKGVLEQFGDRIQSRLLEGSLIELAGRDRRRDGIEARLTRLDQHV